MQYKHKLVSAEVGESGRVTGKVLLRWVEGKTEHERTILGHRPEPFTVEPPVTPTKLQDAVRRSAAIAHRNLLNTDNGIGGPVIAALEAMLDEEQPR